MSFLRDQNFPTEERLLGSPISVNADIPVTESTAGNVTYTVAQVLRGILARDPNGASRTDVLPTAAQLVAAIAAKYGAAQVGMRVRWMLVNASAGAFTITVTLGAGMTSKVGGTQLSAAIAQNASRTYYFVLTNVSAGNEAMDVYAE